MIAIWAGFFVIIIALLAIDLGVVNRKDHTIGMREATAWSIVWISVGLAFSGLVYVAYEHHWGGLGLSGSGLKGLTAFEQYLTAYLVEKSLSVDNIFVMAMVFRYFKVPAMYQHKVLFWGILGAIVFRGIMIGVGIALVQQFDWIFYVFGAFLLFTAIRMLMNQDHDVDPGDMRIVRWARKVIPLVDRYDGHNFTVRENGKRYFTLLFLALIVIEATDVVFAVDSIPAIFGFTQDGFIVMTSNIFAILGLRALYFVVAGAMREFRYLNLAVSIILILVALKMLLHDVIHFEDETLEARISLFVVLGVLTFGVVASIVANKRDARTGTADGAPDAPEDDHPNPPVPPDIL